MYHAYAGLIDALVEVQYQLEITLKNRCPSGRAGFAVW
jgi:hypothetical protein